MMLVAMAFEASAKLDYDYDYLPLGHAIFPNSERSSASFLPKSGAVPELSQESFSEQRKGYWR